MKTAIELIAQERKEQINKHGFTVAYDASYSNDELLSAAKYCLTGYLSDYPAGWNHWFMNKLESKTELEKQIIAAALIAANIDRLLNQKEANS